MVMNILSLEKGIEILLQQFKDGKLIPVFGAGFSSGSEAKKGVVPDGRKANELMKNIILNKVDFVTEKDLKDKNFNDTAKLFNQLNRRGELGDEYRRFFGNNFTQAKIGTLKHDFLKIEWPYALTLNVDDAIEQTGEFRKILPYLDAVIENNKKNRNHDKILYKLHGDAAFEYDYPNENIIFDIDQYTKSMNDEHNFSFRECVRNTFRDFNMLFIGCGLTNEPDLKYLYNIIKGQEKENSRYILRMNAPDKMEEMTLEEHGITDVILTNNFEQFYFLFIDKYNENNVAKIVSEYPFKNPTVKVEADSDLKYFGGFNVFDEDKNCFHKTKLIVDRDCIKEVQNSLKEIDIVLLVGRRFSGKTAILCLLCEKEVSRAIYFFPSTTLTSTDVIQKLLNEAEHSLFIFDTNSISTNTYFFIRDNSELLKQNNNKIIMSVNQSDNYFREIINCKEVPVKNHFSPREVELFKEQSGEFAFSTKKRDIYTNLDFLQYLYQEQKIVAYKAMQPLRIDTENECILLIIMYVKDKIFTKEIYSLGIKDSELQKFIDKSNGLIELINISRGESSTASTRKLVHNSKLILIKNIQNLKNEDVLNAIIRIVNVFIKGSYDQKRIYKEVMQFDTLNYLFGRKKGAGKLIFEVYSKLQPILKDDLHYWLQRAKSIYRLMPDNRYWRLKEAYRYAKKAYIDSTQKNLTAKAALTTSLICCLLYPLERKANEKQEYRKEALRLGCEAIESEYYRFPDRLNTDLENNHKSYKSRILKICDEEFAYDNDECTYILKLKKKLK